MNENIVVINMTNNIINLYPGDTINFETPIRKGDKAKFLESCLQFPASGHAKVDIFRDPDSKKIKVKNSQKNITLNYTTIGLTSQLPDEKDGVIYVVSQLVYNSLHHSRKDVYLIDQPVRSEDGGVVACRSFARCNYEEHITPIKRVISYLGDRLAGELSDKEFKKVMELVTDLNKYIAK